MASLKGAVLFFVCGEGLERRTTVAFLVLLQVGHRVVPNETIQRVQLEVVLKIESLTPLRLLVCVVVVLVACVGESAEELLLSLKAQLG